MNVQTRAFPLASRQSALLLAHILLFTALWSVTHRYLGLDGDARLYAVQAMSRIVPAMSHDLFLSNFSQDQFTIFSPLYAKCIEMIGLQKAALYLTFTFKIWFLIAAWFAARSFSSHRAAVFTVILFIAVVGRYGANLVFQYSEDWVTARSLAEALVVTALATHYRDYKKTALLIASGAMFVHPLMALPGLLLLLCLELPPRWYAPAGCFAVLAALIVALLATRIKTPHMLEIMDPEWREIVLQRSQYLFLQEWPVRDWALNITPLLTLALAAWSTSDKRFRNFCWAATLVGTVGLFIALIASTVGPVPLLLQGQAWRWIWIAHFAALLALLPTLMNLWPRASTGAPCATLLMCAWVSSPISGLLAICLVVGIYLGHAAVPPQWSRIAAACMWLLAIVFAIVNFRNPWHDHHLSPVAATASAAAAAYLLVVSPTRYGAMTIAVLLLICAVQLPVVLKTSRPDGSAADVTEFARWREIIPPTATVLVTPTPMSAGFSWFVLQRPNYLSIDQSSGVVFSRGTAMEVRRRSATLKAIWLPGWQVYTRNQALRGGATTSSLLANPLDKESLLHACSDPSLNFVVSKEDIGLPHIGHDHPGLWADWKLYDCHALNGTAGRLLN